MTAPWFARSVATLKTKSKTTSHYSRILALRLLQQSFAAGCWDGMDMFSMPCLQTWKNMSVQKCDYKVMHFNVVLSLMYSLNCGIYIVICTLRLINHFRVRVPVSNLSQIFRFPLPEGKEGPERHGLNVSRLTSVIVAWLGLIHKTDRCSESQCSA